MVSEEQRMRRRCRSAASRHLPHVDVVAYCFPQFLVEQLREIQTSHMDAIGAVKARLNRVSSVWFRDLQAGNEPVGGERRSPVPDPRPPDYLTMTLTCAVVQQH